MDNRQQQALDVICATALAAHEAIGTEDEVSAYQKYIDVLKNELFFYLECVCATGVGRSIDEELRSDLYYRVISDVNLMSRLVRGYDAAKANYVNFFVLIINSEKKKVEAASKEDKMRHGVTKDLSTREDRALRALVKLEPDLGHLSEEKKKTLAAQMGFSVEKLDKILRTNLFATAVSYDLVLEQSDDDAWDDYGSDVEIMKYGAYEIKESEEEDSEFVAFLRRLNSLYETSFSERDKLVFPAGFTGRYIECVAETVQKERNLKSIAEVEQGYWDCLLLDDRKDRYANGAYYCVVAPVFDITLQQKMIIKQNGIAKMIQVSPSVLSKVMKKIMELVQN